MKKLGLLIAGIALFFSASPVFAGLISSVFVGNIIQQPGSNIDNIHSNYTVIDKNSSVNLTGNLSFFTYYTTNINPFRFVLVDQNSVVKWVSDLVSSPDIGLHFTNIPRIPVQAGWYMGFYFPDTSSIPYDLGGQQSSWTPSGSGEPVVGSTLNFENISGQPDTDRIYSFIAFGDSTVLTKDDCKKDGWETNFGVFKNQGQCVSYFEHLSH